MVRRVEKLKKMGTNAKQQLGWLVEGRRIRGRTGLKSDNKKDPLISESFLLWCGPGSNRRHKDFQSFALPTELPHHSVDSELFVRAANIGQAALNSKKLGLFIENQL